MLIYADISSLYPSLAEELNIQPSKDELKLFSTFVPLIKEVRYEAKYAGEKAKDGALKILLNTGAYGWLGWAYGMFNDYNEAERITKWGQKVIKKVNESAEVLGGKVLKCDTDGSLIIVPEKYRGSKESETEYIKEIEVLLNRWLKKELGNTNGLTLEHDGRYRKAILFDDKSYCLLSHEGKLTIKGNTLRSRGSEQFINQFVQDCIWHIFNEQPEKIVEEYEKWHKLIEYKLMAADQVCKRESINMSLETYRNKIAAGQNPIATYEAALSATKNYVKGDTIVTWVEEPEPILKEYKTKEDVWVVPKNAPSYETIRLKDNFNENIYRHHYHDRLEKAVKKFLVVLGYDEFQIYFPDISILKDDRAKFIAVWGLDKFHEKFPSFSYRKKDIKHVDIDKINSYVKQGIINESLIEN